MELENTAVETVETETDQEVVEPDESPEEGSNYQEVANPESEDVAGEQSHEDNARFQEYRHKMEDAQRERDDALRELEELRAAQKVREDVYSEYMDDEDIDSVLADAFGVSPEDVKARIEERAEFERLRAENERFKAEKEEAERREAEARSNEALTNQLAEVQAIDPSIKNVLDFEDKFQGLSYTPEDYLKAGLTLKQAYYALKAEQDMRKRTPPPEIGGVKNEEPETVEYSKEDVMAMTPEQRAKNWKAIRAAQMSGKW